MSEVHAFLTGIYARSDALARATQDHDRGRIDDLSLQKQLQQDRQSLLELQKSSGLTYLTDGLINWQDLFRPLLEVVSGLEAGPLVRFFDNNTFYRQPAVTGSLALRTEKLEPWLDRYFRFPIPFSTTWKATLPSPYFFAQVAKDSVYREKSKLIEVFVDTVLLPIAEKLAARDVRFLQLQEPWLVTHPSLATDLRVWQKTVSTLHTILTRKKIKLGVHTYFGDASPVLSTLLEFDLDAVGIDFFETSLDQLKNISFGKELICGCLDARNSWLEKESTIADFIRQVQATLEPPTLYLTTNSDLEFVPEPVARRKVDLLGRLAAQFDSEKS
jgi:5-methyltetrahydropteroyltriglutamate--homocysteine methyltransferase